MKHCFVILDWKCFEHSPIGVDWAGTSAGRPFYEIDYLIFMIPIKSFRASIEIKPSWNWKNDDHKKFV